jgi:hypothetical protein
LKPALSDRGKIVFEVTLTKNLTVFDDHRDAPVGFGSEGKFDEKTYVIQRRVPSDARDVKEDKKPSSVLK